MGYSVKPKEVVVTPVAPSSIRTWPATLFRSTLRIMAPSRSSSPETPPPWCRTRDAKEDDSRRPCFPSTIGRPSRRARPAPRPRTGPPGEQPPGRRLEIRLGLPANRDGLACRTGRVIRHRQPGLVVARVLLQNPPRAHRAERRPYVDHRTCPAALHSACAVPSCPAHRGVPGPPAPRHVIAAPRREARHRRKRHHASPAGSRPEPDRVLRRPVVVRNIAPRRLDAHLERRMARPRPREPPAEADPEPVLGTRMAVRALAPRALHPELQGEPAATRSVKRAPRRRSRPVSESPSPNSGVAVQPSSNTASP